MRIGINLLYLLPRVVGGTEIYASGLLHGLAKEDRDNEYVIFVNKESSDWPIPDAVNFSRIVCPVAGSNRARRYWFEQLRLPGLVRKLRIEIVHSLGYVGPLWPPCPAVVTVPDLNYIAIGHIMPSCKRFVLKTISTLAAKRAAAVITISNYSKNAICEMGGINPYKVFVTLLGPRQKQRDLPFSEAVEIQKKYEVKPPYLAAFGGGSVHKNIPRLLRAFAELKSKLPYRLLLIGHLPYDVDPKELPDGVMATGYVPAQHVLPLLGGAEVFVLPSLYEGFGLPILEAQQAGVPVVCSTSGSLPEVAGEAAVFFDPYSVKDMADTIVRVARDTALRAELRQRGLDNVKRFSWEQTARLTLEVYKSILNGSGFVR